MKPVNVGIIGLGTVGGGTVRLIQNHHDDYLSSYGIDLVIKKACARSEKHAVELGLDGDTFTTDWHDVVLDPSIDIVVELIGGDHPATEIAELAFAHKKHVVTANKALLAHDMGRLAGLARKNGMQLKCEAAAAGGIPIVKALENSFAGNSIQTIAGIVNGTTNYMLTRMELENLTFDEVLTDAQRLGYAEADPTADVDGWDAANKMAILASIGFNTRVTLQDVSCVEGIRSLEPIDIKYAHDLGYRVKLLGVARKLADGLDVRVHPAMVEIHHQLASVDGVFNAVYVVGDAVGETMFTGAGAGAFPTASAVVGDILDLAAPIAAELELLPEPEPFERVMDICSIDNLIDRYYIRISLEDKPGMLSKVTSIFAEHEVSLATVSQPASERGAQAQVIVVTHSAQEAHVRKACEAITNLDGVHKEPVVIRVENTKVWKSASL